MLIIWNYKLQATFTSKSNFSENRRKYRDGKEEMRETCTGSTQSHIPSYQHIPNHRKESANSKKVVKRLNKHWLFVIRKSIFTTSIDEIFTI